MTNRCPRREMRSEIGQCCVVSLDRLFECATECTQQDRRVMFLTFAFTTSSAGFAVLSSSPSSQEVKTALEANRLRRKQKVLKFVHRI